MVCRRLPDSTTSNHYYAQNPNFKKFKEIRTRSRLQERPLSSIWYIPRPKSQWRNANHQAEIIMQMLNDCTVANKMPSRVSEIRVDQAYSGYHRRVLSIGEIKCETRCCVVVVNQVEDIYRSVRSERFVMLFDGRNFVSGVDVMLRGDVGVVCMRLQDRFSTAWCSLVATATRASSRLMSLAPCRGKG